MSVQTIQVDQFLLNKLQPEIDRLNLSLISMEENGYDNRAMHITRNKLNKLIPIYDFLKEYAYGKEEMDTGLLTTLLDLVGTYNLSNKVPKQLVQSTREDLSINDSTCSNIIRVYKDGEILRTNKLHPSTEPISLQIYAHETVEELNVTVYIQGTPPIVLSGINNVRIDNLNISVIEDLHMDISTRNICGETTTTTEDFTINNQNCSTPVYWLGSTSERFTIGTTDINETSEMSITPNMGSNTNGTKLNYTWITENTADIRSYAFVDGAERIIDIPEGNAHVILLIPTAYKLTSMYELVGESEIPMTAGLHYGEFAMMNFKSLTFKCIYMRDLTDFTFSARRLKLLISEV